MAEKEDLGIRVGTKEEAFWEGFKKAQEQVITGAKHEVEIAKHLIKFADDKIKAEKEKNV